MKRRRDQQRFVGGECVEDRTSRGEFRRHDRRPDRFQQVGTIRLGGLFADNEAYLPRSGYEKDEVFVDNQVLKQKLAELWIKVKATK